jgi:hypothetical protein
MNKQTNSQTTPKKPPPAAAVVAALQIAHAVVFVRQ